MAEAPAEGFLKAVVLYASLMSEQILICTYVGDIEPTNGEIRVAGRFPTTQRSRVGLLSPQVIASATF